ncbi:MAG: hypothetical protein LBN11_05040, partial [Tannerella sp.]|nr:hypothetical protein [Tannerella sp.]
MKQKILLLFLLFLGCGSYTFAQSFEFLNDGVPVADNSTVNFGNLSGLTTSPIMISKTGSETVTATLTITVSGDSYGGIIGYCGWGYESCIPVNPGESISSDKTVTNNEAIDPSIEAMPQGIMGAGFLFKTEYKLTYNGKEQKITAIFSSEPLAIISPNETSVVSIVKEDGRMVCKYDFTSTAT